MKHIDDLLSKLTEKQKNMVLNIRPDYQITLYNYITTILIKHVDEMGCVAVNGNKILLEHYVNNIIYRNSSVIEQFLYDNETSVEMLSKYLSQEINGNSKAKENDVDYALTYQNTIYTNSSVEFVCIKNIIGTLCEEYNITLEQMLASLYLDNDSYSSRSNKFLKEDINSNIERIKELDPIDLIMINDKYYIKSDGHHRVYYLIMCYLIEISKCNSQEQIEIIDGKYTLPFNVTKKSNNELLNMISYAMIKSNDDDLKVTEFDVEDGSMKIQLNDNTYDIKNDEELLNILSDYLSKTNNPKLIYILSTIGFFEKYNLNVENENYAHKTL